MGAFDVIRIPVDHEPDIRASIIPRVAKRMAAEGLDTSSQAAVIRWGLRDAANPRRRSTTNVGIENDVARSMIDDLRGELGDANEALGMERTAVDGLFTKNVALRAELAGSELLMDSMAAEVSRLTQRAEAAESKAAGIENRLYDTALSLGNANEDLLASRLALVDARAQWASSNAAAVDDSESKERRFMPMATDGARLKAAREAAGMSQSALAAHLGYADKSSIGLAERGRAPLSVSMVAWLEGQGR